MVNVGSLDRTLRFVLGAILIIAPFVPPLAGILAPVGSVEVRPPCRGIGDARHCTLPGLSRLHAVRHPHLQGGPQWMSRWPGLHMFRILR